MISKLKANWLGASAAIAAAIATLNKAWDLAKTAADYNEQMSLINGLARQYGTSAQSIVDSITQVSDGMISMQGAAQVAAEGLQKGLSPEMLRGLSEAAVVLSDTMGTTAEEAFAKMASGLELNKEKTIKAAIGAFDLKERYGELADKMSETEKQTALYNMIMEETQRVQALTGDGAKSTSDKMETLVATLKNLQLTMGQGVLRAAAGVMGIFQGLAGAALYLFGAFAKVQQGISFLQGDFEGAGKYAEVASTAFDAAAEQMGKAGDNLSAMVAPAEDFQKAMSRMNKEVKVNQKLLDEEAATAKKIKDALQGWADKIETMNPTLSKHDQAVVTLWNDYEKLKEKLIELKAPATAFEEAQKKMFDGLNFQAMLEKVETYKKELESEKDLLTEQVDILKDWRESAVDAYEGAVDAAKKYASELMTIDKLLAHGKDFLSGGPDMNIDKQKDRLKDMADQAWKSNDVGQMSAAMKALEDFISKNKAIDTSAQKDLYADLLWKLERMKTSTEQSMTAAETAAQEILNQIANVDEQILVLQDKLANIEVTLKTDNAVLAAQNLKAEVDRLLPDNMIKTLTIKTVLVGFDNTGITYADPGPAYEDVPPVAVGTNSVKRSGLAYIHQGEAIIPAGKNGSSTSAFTFAPSISVTSAGGDGQSIAKQIDAELSRMFRDGVSQLQQQMKRGRN